MTSPRPSGHAACLLLLTLRETRDTATPLSEAAAIRRTKRFVDAHNVFRETFHRVPSRQSDSTRAKGPRNSRSPTQLHQERSRERVGPVFDVHARPWLLRRRLCLGRRRRLRGTKVLFAQCMDRGPVVAPVL